MDADEAECSMTKSRGNGGGGREVCRDFHGQKQLPSPPPVDWTNLPELVIDQILGMLDSPKDYLRFLLVCKTWKYYVLRLWPYKKANYKGFLSHHPTLIVSNHLYSIGESTGCFEGPMQQWRPKFASSCRDCRVIGSSFGWLVTHAHLNFILLTSPKSNSIFIHNISLTDSQKLAGFHSSKAVLSKDPSSFGNFHIAVLFRNPSSSTEVTRLLLLDYSRDGYEFYQTSDHVLDIAQHNSSIYILQKEIPGTVNFVPEGLVIVHLSLTSGMTREAKIVRIWDDSTFERKPLHPRVGSYSSTPYLVVRLSGRGGFVLYNHWLVMRHEIMGELGRAATVGFQVFEWVPSEKDSQGSMLWRRVDELKNEAIFLSRGSAFSIPGSGLLAAGGLQPNCIYFTNDQQVNGEKEHDVIPPDIGVFDMVQGRVKPFGFPEEFNYLRDYDVRENHGPPLWFATKP